MKTLRFETEAQQLLQLVIHSIYSSPDLFLRELVSNASDALDKLRIEAFRDKDLPADLDDLHIAIELDPAARMLTVRDNGIGMTYDEVIELIGTIARSGTAEYARSLGERPAAGAPRADFVGQFGVGLYASFMVADEITVVTRRVGEPDGCRWQSRGEETYTVERVVGVPTGTSVKLRLKPSADIGDGRDYTDPSTVREIVRRYSDFVVWPIRMSAPLPEDAADDDSIEGLHPNPPERPGSGGPGEPPPEPETLNSDRPFWHRDSPVAEADHSALYRRLTGDSSAPIVTVPVEAEGRFEFRAVLFVPSQAAQDLYAAGSANQLELYVRHVLVTGDAAGLLPGYLRFVAGVIDAPDLPLTVSRESLQADPRIRLIRRQLTKRVLAALARLQADDDRRYADFWARYGAVLKEGLVDDAANRLALLRLCRFSTAAVDGPVTLTDYVQSMPPEQESIWYLTGAAVTVLRGSPHLEAVTAAGQDVLLLGDPVDQIWVEADPTFADHPMRSVAGSAADNPTEDGPGPAGNPAHDAGERDRFADLLAWMRGRLDTQVVDVRLSSRLTTSPVRLVTASPDVPVGLDPAYRYALRATAGRTLEINPRHPLVRQLHEAHSQPAGGRTGRTEEQLAEEVDILHGMAVLAEGGILADPGRFVQSVANRLSAEAESRRGGLRL